ncbi:TetR/AcrR family transcriptional regulator [Bacillus sp. FJAT-28004]|uniref:TetR/AcrR family transcriptional regulator n=1 Tax=Bacillus sp. FJAT-28004 TaxID=1679165 RepID=UPI0006B54FAD|nr:TetR/AcrR family transcriptional regulator [Bacillus sp. FJAT-28004]
MSKSEETLASIKQVSYQLFAEVGITKTTYSMIAKAVGIAKPSIYYYFKSKEDLIAAIFEDLCSAIEFSTFFEVETFTKENFEEKLIAFGTHMIDEQAKDPYYNRVLQEYMLMATRLPFYHEKLLMIQKGYLQGFEMLMEKARKFGLVSDQNFVAKAHVLALVLDNIGNFMMLVEHVDYKQIWVEAVSSVFKGSDARGSE